MGNCRKLRHQGSCFIFLCKKSYRYLLFSTHIRSQCYFHLDPFMTWRNLSPPKCQVNKTFSSFVDYKWPHIIWHEMKCVAWFCTDVSGTFQPAGHHNHRILGMVVYTSHLSFWRSIRKPWHSSEAETPGARAIRSMSMNQYEPSNSKQSTILTQIPNPL